MTRTDRPRPARTEGPAVPSSGGAPNGDPAGASGMIAPGIGGAALAPWPLVRAARAVGAALAQLLARPLRSVAGWLRRSTTMPDLEDPGESLLARLARGGAPAFVRREVATVSADANLDVAGYAALFDDLQRDPGPKLLDLRRIRAVPIGLFNTLARSWHVGCDVVPRLAIVLDYERWSLLYAVGGSRLRSITRRGIEVEIFYELQLPHAVGAWFAGRAVEHPIPAILEWLRGAWRPSLHWAIVVDTTAMLIGSFSEPAVLPDQLLQLAAIALARCGVEGAVEARKHTRDALRLLGDTPSRMQCHARRLRARALHTGGEIEAALAQADRAIGVAAKIGDWTEGAMALADVAAWELARGNAADAEARCRAALALLSTDHGSYLRANLHHHLARALHEQRAKLDEAEHHATSALGLRWDPESRLAIADRELIARIRASRSSPLTGCREATA